MEEPINSGGRKKSALENILLLLVPISSLVSFWVLERAINVADASVWRAPILSFSSFFIVLCLLVVVAKRIRPVELAIALSYLISFLFSFDLSRAAFLLAAFLLTFLAIGRIRKDLSLNIHIDLGKSLGAGKTLVIVSFALLISSQYFSEIRDRSSQAMIPSLELGNTSGMVTSRILSLVNPEYEDINNKNLSVDEFLGEVAIDQFSASGTSEINIDVDEIIRRKGGGVLTESQKEEIKDEAAREIAESKKEISESAKKVAMIEGRRKLSEIAGKELTGQERMADVFSDVINRKITSYFQPVMSDRQAPPLIPMILALILFLTVVPLGNFLTIVIIPFTSLVFHFLKKAGIVRTEKVMMEVERLA